MRKIGLLSIILLIFFASCEYSGKSKKEPKNSQSKWIINSEGDSIIRKYRKDGSILSTAVYKNGKKNGLAVNYYENGKIRNKIFYVNNIKHGIAIWNYENEKLYRETPYQNGKIEGLQKKYYENGNLMAEIPYKNGQVIPGLKEYKKNGKQKSNYPKIVFKTVDKIAFENELILKFYLSNKKKQVKFYKYIELNDNESIRAEIPTNNGIGEIKFYISPGTYKMEKIKIRAELKTSLRNLYVTESYYNLAVENRK